MPISSQLMSMFVYLHGVFSIRNTASATIIDSRVITSDDPKTVHQDLLTYLFNKGTYNNALVHEDEIVLLRNLGDISDNEIAEFLVNNTTWDVLILSPYTISDLVSIPGFSIVKKSTSATTFNDKYVYIASKQFMEKMKNNTLTDIQTYVYTNPFLNSISKVNVIETNKYIVSQVVALDTLNSGETLYQWRELSLS
jgi:hypothetical protein